jgi:hypothetical protein
LDLAGNLQIALHDDPVGDLEHEQQEQEKATPEVEVELNDVKVFSRTAIAESAAGKEQKHEGGDQQEAPGGREFFDHCPEKFLYYMQTVAAPGETLWRFRGYVTRIETIAGARFVFEL